MNKILIETNALDKDLLISSLKLILTYMCEDGKLNQFRVTDIKNDELILRIPLDEVDKLRYALDHVQLTGDEHIDAVLSTFNDVLKESLLTHENAHRPK